MANAGFCFECGAQGGYEFRKSIRKYEGEGYGFELVVDIPFCQACGAPIYDEVIEQGISEQANSIIRKQRQIITKEEIQEILKVYGLSQKYLSRLLGWGEITLTRYINGNYTPNKSNSDKLKGLKNPYLFQRMLDGNARKTDGEIQEEKPFQKAQKKVDEVFGGLERANGRIFSVAHWFLSQSSEEAPVTHLALQKLLYFTQGWSMALLHREMFEGRCQAWAHGAVYPKVYRLLKPFRFDPLPKVRREEAFAEEERQVLEAVKKYYFDRYNAKTLEEICHYEEPYRKAREGYHEEEPCQEEIDREEMKGYYSKVSRQYKIEPGNMSNMGEYLHDVVSKCMS